MNKTFKKYFSFLLAFSIFFTSFFIQSDLKTMSLANAEPVNLSSMKGLKNKPLYIKDSRLGTINENTKVTFVNEEGQNKEFSSIYDEDMGLYYLELVFDEAGSFKLVQDNIDGAVDSNEISIDVYENLGSMTGSSNGYVSVDTLKSNPSIIGEKLEELFSTLIGYDASGEYTEVTVNLSNGSNSGIFNIYNNGLSSSVSAGEDTYLPAGKYNVKVSAGSYSENLSLDLLSPYTNKVDLENNEQAQVAMASANTLSGESSTSAIVTVTRQAGRSRYDTAVEISKNKFSNASTVVLANGEASNDILVASSLAGNLNAPILITKGNNLNPATKAEIQRLKAGKVIVIGGTSKVSNGAINELKSMGKTVEVISANTDEDMSVKVASKAMSVKKSDTVIISSKDSLPDSLSASSLAANKGYPILYVSKGSVSSGVKNYINSGSFKNAIVVGGELTVNNSVVSALNSLGVGVDRVYGQNRYKTSAAIANKYFKNASTVGVATGKEFVDSLTAGPASGLNSQAILLVDNNTISSEIKSYMQSTKAKNVVIYGGPNWISEGFKTAMLSLLNQIHNTSQVQDVEDKPAQTKPDGKVRILLDPGHGAGAKHNRGYVGPRWKNEGDGNYHYSLLLAKELRSYGIVVDTTRSNINQDPSLAARGSKGAGYDLFISLHTNAANKSAKGVEIYEDVNNRATTLATNLTKTISQTLSIPNRGVKYRYYGDNDSGVNPKANYYGVLRANGATAGMLIEHCFHDNMDDVVRYENNAETLAKNMARTIAKYFGLI